MEWPFSPRQREIAAVADEIGREALEPNAEELDRTGLYPRANLLHTARAGLNGPVAAKRQEEVRLSRGRWRCPVVGAADGPRRFHAPI